MPSISADILKNSLKAISIETLRAGMIMPEDIYSANASRVLLKRGAEMDAETFKRVKKINGDSDIIYVSAKTYKDLMKRGFEADLEAWLLAERMNEARQVEDEVGYTDVKNDTLEMLSEIAQDEVLPQKALESVSENLSQQLETTAPATIVSLINALAPVDEYLQRHCINVSLLNGLLGKWLNLPQDAVDRLVLVGLLHDCGKAMVPARVLSAPRRLTMVEYEVIKMHPVHTYELLKEFPSAVRLGARCHHEKVNGQGYPDQLSGDSIPFEARVTAVSDIYDAMVSQRAYKKPNSPFSIMAMLETLKDTELDAQLVNVFIRNMPQELLDKKVVLSNGSTGIIRSVDVETIEFPQVEVDGRLLQCDEALHCVSMY